MYVMQVDTVGQVDTVDDREEERDVAGVVELLADVSEGTVSSFCSGE